MIEGAHYEIQSRSLRHSSSLALICNSIGSDGWKDVQQKKRSIVSIPTLPMAECQMELEAAMLLNSSSKAGSVN